MQYWWVTASERGDRPWHWEEFFENPRPPRNFRWGHNIQSRSSFKCIEAMAKGDVVVAYQAGEGVLGLATLASEGWQESEGGPYNRFDLDWRPDRFLRLQFLVPLKAIKELPDAKDHFGFVPNPRGTVFEVTSEGFGELLRLALEANPGQSRELRSFLSTAGVPTALHPSD